MKEILILDIETTGFLNMGGSIVEVGAVSLDLDSGEIKPVFDSLVREDMLSAKHRSKPFGWIFDNSDLTVEMVRAAPRAEFVFPKVRELIAAYPLGATAFNNRFDFGFLEDRGIEIPVKLPCPMLLTTDVCKLPGKRGGYKWPKVEEAYRFLFPDREYTEKHRGLDDARHEAEIVYALWERGIFKI